MSAYGHTGGSPGPLTGCGKTLYGRKDVPGHEFTRPALACRGCRKSFRMCWALERFHNYCIRYRGRAGLQACVKMQDKWASATVLRGIHQFWNCYKSLCLCVSVVMVFLERNILVCHPGRS